MSSLEPLNKKLASRYGSAELAEYNIWHWMRAKVQSGLSSDEIAIAANKRFDIGRKQLESIAWKYAFERQMGYTDANNPEEL